ncbi:GGDEF domain-containing phosphodiesterase [Tsuneonella mangrovi]|uniref:GGDEF domain-containing phosphodiesterase n=1 Tax=Tsuneonella mangrovi TaxID=1982042 RepID=UPI000BA21348|nr:GGDEF domain-containing phosphodiesterase [Tsuneonella mangrovi]
MTTMPDQPALSSRDALTGLADADHARSLLDRWCGAAAQDTRRVPVQAMMLGLGRFDTINLAYGETVGDSALVEVARRIRLMAEDEFEEGDWLVARAGGGQFLVAAREACSRERWQWLAEAMADAVAAPISIPGGTQAVRLWPRLALVRVLPGERSEHVLDRLASTLERAKDLPAARIAWAGHVHALPGHRSAELEADLLAALDRDEIEIAIQPQYSLASGCLVGGEALARWQHPTIGRIGAAALFAIAERADHVAHLSRHIAERSLAIAADWPAPLRLSLNVTPNDLATASFAREFAALVSESGFPPERLTLEITEHVLLTDLENAAEKLGRLAEGGMRIALDDFGGGFCNFGYLKLLPLDYLKLDRSMITGIVEDARDRAILRAIVAMADALKLKVIAEGIETEEQRAIVAEEGCELFQGFLRSPPVNAAEFAALAKAAVGKAGLPR